MATYAEQISAFEAKRAANVAAMDGIMSKSANEGATLDAEQQEEFDGLLADNEAIDAHLKRLRAMEKAAAASAKPVKGDGEKSASESRDPRISAQVKTTPKLAPGIGFARLARCKGLAQITRESPREIARQLYGEDSATYGILAKGAVAAGNTGNASWAGNLVGDETSVFADFVEYLRPTTILGRFGMNGIPALRSVPFRTALIGQSSGGSGYWVGEGKPKPLTKFDFTRTSLEELKVANIAVVTKEILQRSAPSAEVIIRDELAKALRARLDIDFVDPDKAAVPGVSPASISYGVSPVVSSGTDADAVRADVQALMQTFIAANNAPTSGVWIMAQTTALTLSLMQNPLGQSEFPGITMMGGNFFGLPVLTSQYVPADTNGAMVLLVNAGDIWFADEGGVTVDMSTEASLQMDDEPGTQDATSGTGTSLVSLWQTNAVGFLAERTLNWAKARASAVARLDQIKWAAGS